MAKYRAIESFAFTGKNGASRVIVKGAIIDGRDPDFKGREQFFELSAPAGHESTTHWGRCCSTPTAGFSPWRRWIRC
jgi:hypothetical protein